MKRILLAFMILTFILTACTPAATPEPTTTPTSSSPATNTPTPTVTLTPTQTPTATPTPLPDEVQAAIEKHDLVFTQFPDGQTWLTPPDHPEWPIFIQDIESPDGWKRIMIFPDEINEGSIDRLLTPEGDLLPFFMETSDQPFGVHLKFTAIVIEEPFQDSDGIWRMPIAIPLSEGIQNDEPMLVVEFRWGPGSIDMGLMRCSGNVIDVERLVNITVGSVDSMMDQFKSGYQVFLYSFISSKIEMLDWLNPAAADNLKDVASWLPSEEGLQSVNALTAVQAKQVDPDMTFVIGAPVQAGVCRP